MTGPLARRCAPVMPVSSRSSCRARRTGDSRPSRYPEMPDHIPRNVPTRSLRFTTSTRPRFRRNAVTTGRSTTPGTSTAPARPSTIARSPVRNRETSIPSTRGISPRIAPVATIASVRSFTIAAGPRPRFARPNSTYEPTVLPFPWGKTRAFPATASPRRSEVPSVTTPDSRSTPPRNDIGWWLARTKPSATPAETARPVSFMPRTSERVARRPRGRPSGRRASGGTRRPCPRGSRRSLRRSRSS